MRRLLSILFLFAGGWLLTAEPIIAFLNFGTDLGPHLPVLIAVMLFFAAVPLAIGTWISPGDRRSQLGLTILIAVGFAILSALSAAAIFLDPAFKQFEPLMPPMPKFTLAPVAGAANLIVVSAIGALLYWWPSDKTGSKSQS